MFPLIALGALVTGTFIIGANASNSQAKARAKSSDPDKPNNPVAPNAYVVIPVGGEASGQRTELSAVEAVRKFIF